jgi:hypothetical protein
MSYRSEILERDLSGFVQASLKETGAMVIESSKGPFKPVEVFGEDDVILYFGQPNSEYNEIFEAIAFSKGAPLWLCSAIGEGALYGGIDVKASSVVAFSSGRDYDTYTYLGSENPAVDEVISNTGTDVDTILANFPVKPGTFVLQDVAVDLCTDDGSGNLSGSGIVGTGTINYATGAITCTLVSGTPTALNADYTYYTGGVTDASHSFFNFSPAADELKMKIESIGGSQFTAILYDLDGNRLMDYHYSVIREKDGYGKSIYIYDVFKDDPYVKAMLNENYSGGAFSLPGTTVTFAGGTRGAKPNASHYYAAWQQFYSLNKYPTKIFMDVAANNATILNTIVTTYQPFAFAITTCPIGLDSADALSYRSGLGIDSDQIAIYTNWAKIVDPYNNSEAWINHVGSMGKKYAMMADAYDAASPAGIDENNHGGQIADWQVIEMDNDYNDSQLQALDEAQLNPLIFDPVYGLMAYGDKTMQVSLSDTSFIGTRRVYNFIEETIQKQILRRQEFKLNDPIHRLKAKMMTDDFLNPIVADGWISEVAVVCDERNNGPIILEQRKFIIDIYIKITPNSQKTTLRLTRLSQTQSISEFL